MISLKSAVYEPPTIEKTATFELSKDVTSWHDEILNQFFEQINFLPKELGVDVVINNVDENEGYAKGSVVVWFNDKKINFPVIVNKYQLSPFDVFVYTKPSGETEYYPANDRNVKRLIASDHMATLENRYDNLVAQHLKTPGGVPPKQSIPLYDMPEGMLEPPYSKMSSWVSKARKEDLKKLAVQLEAEPGVLQSFVDNTGDLITNVVNLQNNAKTTTPDDHKWGILDLNDVVKSKRALTVIDAHMFDVNKLTPILPPSVCELRKFSYPSMEDFVESGENAAQRFLASKNGKPIVGIVIDMKEDCDLNMRGDSVQCCPTALVEKDENGKPIIRNKRPQVFISLDGKSYSTFDDWYKKGIGFYGSKVMSVAGAVEKAIKMIADNRISDMFTNSNSKNRMDGSDKSFNPIHELDQGKRDYYGEMAFDGAKNLIFILYGAGDAWECVKLYSNFKKIMVNSSPVYQSEDIVLIPARIASIQKVDSVENPVYKMIVGKAKNIYLIPETSVVLNGRFMECLNPNDFLMPDKSVQAAYEEANIPKVAFVVENANGYKISGKSIEPLFKLAGIKPDSQLNTKEMLSVLMTIGMTKQAAAEAMQCAATRFMNKNSTPVSVYGIRDDYINEGALEKKAKYERINGIMKQIADKIRVNLVKEASLLEDPDAVDTVLSLNFINEDNLMDYVDSIGSMRKVISKLASMLIASRMGLGDIEEDAVKKAMDGLQGVVDGLENVKLSLGK
jgi:hypothetical protein